MSERVIARRLWQCPSCGKRYRIPAAADDPGLCPECNDNTVELVEDESPAIESLRRQIGGWLFLPAFHFAWNSSVTVAATWAAHISGVELDWSWVVLFDAYAVLTIYVATRFFRLKKDAPAWMMAWYMAGALRSVFLTEFAQPSQTAVTIIMAACFIAYFAKSRRVKETFVMP